MMSLHVICGLHPPSPNQKSWPHLCIRAFMEFRAKMKDLFFVYIWQKKKKIQRISGENPFFLVFRYVWQDISAANTKSAGAPRVNTALKKIIRPTPSLQF